MSDNILTEEMRNVLTGQGLRGAKLLSVLGKQSRLMQAFETDIGKELLRGALTQANMALERIVNETATPGELAEFRVLKRILIDWAQRIETYYENLDKIPMEVKKHVR